MTESTAAADIFGDEEQQDVKEEAPVGDDGADGAEDPVQDREDGYWEYWMYCAVGGGCRYGGGLIHKYYDEDAAHWGACNHVHKSPHHNFTEEEAEQAVLDNPECIKCYFIKYEKEKQAVPLGKGKRGKGKGSASSGCSSSAGDAGIVRPSVAAGKKRSLSPSVPPRRALQAAPAPADAAARKKPLEVVVASAGDKRRQFVNTVAKLTACVKNAEAAARVCARQQRQGAEFFEAEAHRIGMEWEDLQDLMGSQ